MWLEKREKPRQILTRFGFVRLAAFGWSRFGILSPGADRRPAVAFLPNLSLRGNWDALGTELFNELHPIS
jgi:hypothetical protein